MSSLLVNRDPDSFLTAARAGEDCGEFLFDDPNYSASSSPQLKPLSSRRGQESIFTFGRGSFPRLLSQAGRMHVSFCGCKSEEANEYASPSNHVEILRTTQEVVWKFCSAPKDPERNVRFARAFAP